MESLEKKLLEYFNLNKKNTKLELKKLFNIKGEKEERILDEALKFLELNGTIYLDKNNNYVLLTDELGIIEGELHISKNGNGYVTNKNKVTVMIPKNLLVNVYDGDIVTVNNIMDNNKKLYGNIDKVLKRVHEQMCFIVKLIDDKKVLIPYENVNENPINIDDKNIKDLVEGQIVLIDIINNKYIRTIGHKDSPDIEIKAIAYNYGFEVDFNEKIEEELKDIPSEISHNRTKIIKDPITKEKKKIYIDDYEGRVDLTNLETITIDPVTANDFDDAISIIKLDKGYKLYVSIADPNYFIKRGSAIYQRGYNNGCSVYTNGKVIPQFPEKVSNGIGSLNPGVDRLTRTHEMTCDENGKIIDYKYYKSVIRSNKRMNYMDVNKLYLNDEEVYPGFKETLETFFGWSELINQKKKDRHYINFDIGDIKVNGRLEKLKIEQNKQGIAQECIENGMTSTGQSFGEYLYWTGFPTIFRVHEGPDEEKIKKFIRDLRNIGYRIYVPQNVDISIIVQSIAEQLKDFDEYGVFSEWLLCCMKPARYDIENEGHFGLGLPYYVKATSPIRDFANFMVYEILDIVESGEYDIDELTEYVRESAIHFSKMERAAIAVDNEVNLMLMAEHMENHIGETKEAIITRINDYGIFIKTSDLFIGKIDLFDMIDDHYEYDEKTVTLVGKRNHIKYHVGDKITCKVKSASKEKRSINFENPTKIKDKQKVLRLA